MKYLEIFRGKVKIVWILHAIEKKKRHWEINSNEKSFLYLVKYCEVGDKDYPFFLDSGKLWIFKNNDCKNVGWTRGQKL